MINESVPEVSPKDSSSNERFGALHEAYERRAHTVSPTKYSRLRQNTLLRVQEIEREITRLLGKKGDSELSQKTILEVGCGDGAWLRFLIQAGVPPENLYGVDLLAERIQRAREKCPGKTTLLCGDASQLPFDNDSFDCVLVFTVFSSILDDHLRVLLAREMLRVVRRGGSILWYDFHVNNPSNPDVRRVTKHEIEGLFPDCTIELQPITLAPPLGQAVAWSPVLYWLLSSIRFLRTHHLGWITRK